LEKRSSDPIFILEQLSRFPPPRMTKHMHKKPETEPGPEAKTRRCLICKTPFPSAWAGERICRRCKATEKWRTGIA
jgi:hypothetical protein